MLESPFTFFRGSALLQAMDLADSPSTNIEVQLCGDAHLSNFGIFSSPERRLVFDVNDFDETTRGPFEWDVKRLAASLALAAESLNFSAKVQERCAQVAARTYRETMRELAAMNVLDVWYLTLDIDTLVSELETFFNDEAMAKVSNVIDRARGRNAQRAFNKLVDIGDGRPRIHYDPPLLVPFDRFLEVSETDSISVVLDGVLSGYAKTLPEDRQELLRKFTPIDAAMKVVGVGSVGTRCWIMLLLGRDENDPFFLQVKEANRSVIDQARNSVSASDHGERVVIGQRLMQATPDLFLGWQPITGNDGIARSYYVRQLYDNKASINIDRMDQTTLQVYARVCAWTLARAHARSGNATEVAGYLGKSEKFDQAIAAYALAYRDRVHHDFAALDSARREGRIQVAT